VEIEIINKKKTKTQEVEEVEIEMEIETVLLRKNNKNLKAEEIEEEYILIEDSLHNKKNPEVLVEDNQEISKKNRFNLNKLIIEEIIKLILRKIVKYLNFEKYLRFLYIWVFMEIFGNF